MSPAELRKRSFGRYAARSCRNIMSDLDSCTEQWKSGHTVTPAGDWIWCSGPAETLQPEYRLRLCWDYAVAKSRRCVSRGMQVRRVETTRYSPLLSCTKQLSVTRIEGLTASGNFCIMRLHVPLWSSVGCCWGGCSEYWLSCLVVTLIANLNSCSQTPIYI